MSPDSSLKNIFIRYVNYVVFCSLGLQEGYECKEFTLNNREGKSSIVGLTIEDCQNLCDITDGCNYFAHEKTKEVCIFTKYICLDVFTKSKQSSSIFFLFCAARHSCLHFFKDVQKF